MIGDYFRSARVSKRMVEDPLAHARGSIAPAEAF